VQAYPAASLPLPPIALTPNWAPAASSTTDNAGLYTLSPLQAGVPYHLYVTPLVGAPYWLYWRVPDPPVTPTLCVLYAVARSTDGTPAQIALSVTPEALACLPTGEVIDTQTLIAPASTQGTVAVAVTPSALLTPPIAYRVALASAQWRGPIPPQESIDLATWIALPTTTRIS
jgi:hypothetical protein